MSFEDDDLLLQVILIVGGLILSIVIGLIFVVVARRQKAAEPDPMVEPVRGTLLVTAMSEGDDESATWSNGWISGVVTIEGRAPYEVRRPGMFLDAQWPQVGQTLPVVVDRADARWLNIVWDEIEGKEVVLVPQFRALADQSAAKYHIRMQRKHPQA